MKCFIGICIINLLTINYVYPQMKLIRINDSIEYHKINDKKRNELIIKDKNQGEDIEIRKNLRLYKMSDKRAILYYTYSDDFGANLLFKDFETYIRYKKYLLYELSNPVDVGIVLSNYTLDNFIIKYPSLLDTITGRYSISNFCLLLNEQDFSFIIKNRNDIILFLVVYYRQYNEAGFMDNLENDDRKIPVVFYNKQLYNILLLFSIEAYQHFELNMNFNFLNLEETMKSDYPKDKIKYWAKKIVFTEIEE